MSSHREGAPRSVPALLFNRREETGVAHRVKRLGLWQSIRWSEYAGQVLALARELLELGLQPGERVALLCENRPEWLVSDLAIQSAGGVTVGVYTTSSAEQLLYYLEHSEAVGLILEDAEQLEKWLEIRNQANSVRWVIVVEPEGFSEGADWQELTARGQERYARDPGPVHARLAAIEPDDVALLMYTSGTTGNPKGAMLTHANLLWAAEALQDACTFDEREELLSYLPLSHIVERLISVVAPLRYGYTISFTENLDTVMQNMQEIRPTIFFAVPRIWEKIYSTVELHMQEAHLLKRYVYRWSLRVCGGERRAGVAALAAQALVLRFLKVRLGLDRVRLAISGAAPIAPEILAYFRSIGVDVREGYGLTETSGLVSINRENVRLGTVGQAFSGVEIKIAADGEILVKSPGIFKGYFKDEAATAQALEGGWFHTGDIGELSEDGFLSITDRKKDILITAGGKNIAPQKIENSLKSSVFINDAVVIGDRRKYLVALLVLDEETVGKWATDRQIPYTTFRDLTQNPEVIKLIEGEVARINKSLARVETIKRFAILPKRLYHEDGEVTATLKVKRASIAQKYADLIESLYE
jgi:long-chain acyl-CoA synthetase